MCIKVWFLPMYRSLLEDLERNEGDFERMGQCFISRVYNWYGYTCADIMYTAIIQSLRLKISSYIRNTAITTQSKINGWHTCVYIAVYHMHTVKELWWLICLYVKHCI